MKKDKKEVKKDLRIRKRPRRTYSKLHKLKILTRTSKLLSEGLNITDIASKLNIPPPTLSRIISNDVLLNEYKKRAKAKLDTQNIKVAKKSLNLALKKAKEAGYRDLVVGAAILQDKTYPQVPGLTQYNIDKNVNIQWKGFEKPHNGNDDTE